MGAIGRHCLANALLLLAGCIPTYQPGSLLPQDAAVASPRDLAGTAGAPDFASSMATLADLAQAANPDLGPMQNVQQPVRIAAGSQVAVTDSKQNVWAADVGLASGGTAYTAGTPVAVSGADPLALYNSERYGANATMFSYTLKLADGSYTVNLGFAETYATAAGQRLFDVSIGGQKVLTAFDIYGTAGAATVVVKSFPATVTGGMLVIAFEPGTIQNPKVDSIEVLPK
jgi:hypothetical protein